MKKIYLFGLLLAAGLLTLASCNDDNDELTDSRLTYYAILDMQGDDFIAVPLGTPYVDPGCLATLDGQDISSEIVTEGVEDVDVNQLGFYTISYTALGSDGFPVSATRTVCVYDPTVTIDMGGSYDTDMGASIYGGSATFAARAANYGNTSQCTGITFDEVVPGIYAVNDLLGGWYWQIRDYGTSYAMTGYVSVDNDGNIEMLDSYISGWGDGLDYLDDGHYDAGTGVISYSVCYAGAIYIDLVLNRAAE